MTVDIDKYLGTWYEFARIKNNFEPNFKNVTAQYLMQIDGSIKVINSGFVNGELKQIIGTAIKTDNDNVLKVSFFPDVYSEYRILFVDDDYQYALVGGEDKNNLWMLARNNNFNKDIYNKFINIALSYNYNVENLIFDEII